MHYLKKVYSIVVLFTMFIVTFVLLTTLINIPLILLENSEMFFSHVAAPIIAFILSVRIFIDILKHVKF